MAKEVLIDIVMPAGEQEGGESMLARWLKPVGAMVTLHEPIVEISTDKVTMEVPAPCSGVIVQCEKAEGDKITAGMVLGRIAEGARFSSVAPSKSLHTVTTTDAIQGGASSGATTAELSPAVRKLLQEHGLTAQQIQGSGRGGRITHQDVMNHIAATRGEGSDRQVTRSAQLIPHSAMRRSVAQHMVQSMTVAPHVTTVFEADMTAVLSDRDRRQAECSQQGMKLSLTPYLIMATVAALRAVPVVNASWRESGIEQYEDYNIGIATALGDKGLIVPVIHRAQDLDLIGVAKRLQDLTTRARDGALSTSDVQGGTFTISNHGVSGSLFAAPIIINQPQAAILGVGKVSYRPVAHKVGDSHQIVIRPMVYITLTIDHRVLDGYQANTFLTALVDWLAAPLH